MLCVCTLCCEDTGVSKVVSLHHIFKWVPAESLTKKTQQRRGPLEILAERWLRPHCIHEYFINIQGCTKCTRSKKCSHRALCSVAASMCLWNGRAERQTDMLLFSFVTPPPGSLIHCHESYVSCWTYMLYLYRQSLDNHSQNNPNSSQSAALIRFTRYPCLPSFYFSPVETFMGIHKETHH